LCNNTTEYSANVNFICNVLIQIFKVFTGWVTTREKSDEFTSCGDEFQMKYTTIDTRTETQTHAGCVVNE
jgi:hypothetical protein